MHEDANMLDVALELSARTARMVVRSVVRAADAMLPLLLPPKDLRLVMGDGSTVTGILLVENNRVIAGLVVHRTQSGVPTVTVKRGPELDRYSAGRYPSEPHRPEDEDDDDCRLPGWADDTRRGSGPWRR